MRIFGFEITRKQSNLMPAMNGRGSSWFWPIIHEPFSGAFQTNVTATVEDNLAYWAVFRCISMISADIGKMDLTLKQKDDDGIWQEAKSAALGQVLAIPNHFQDTGQFIENWLQSKLARGNTYALKQRDDREVVTALYILDPLRTRPLISTSGEVFYECNLDYLSKVPDQITVPASEIIHDRWNCFYHPLVGLSPLYAAGITALLAKRIQEGSTSFFSNASIPAGLITAPGYITDDQAQAASRRWNANYSGTNRGKVAVLGDGMTFTQLRMTANDAQLIEQLKWSDSMIAGAFGVPAYMINAGTAPAYNNVEALALQYYTQALQPLINALQRCLDSGLGLTDVPGKIYGARFDLDDLLRMDTSTMVTTLQNAVKGILSANEARKKLGYGPTDGGEAVLTQSQNISIEAVADSATAQPMTPTRQQQEQDQQSIDSEQAARALLAIHKGLAHANI